jgi:hypothetical protein
MVHRDDANKPNIRDLPIRDFEEAIPRWQNAFEVFCRYLKESKRSRLHLLSDDDKDLLDYFDSKSFHPIMPAVCSVPLPYPGFPIARLFRADLMHSLLGLLRNWVFYTYVSLIQECRRSKYKGRFNLGPAKLDIALANMHNLLQSCMPYEHSHFSKGMSLFCHATRSGTKSKATQSGMGKLDSAKVKDLVLQMLLCKLLNLCYVQFLTRTHNYDMFKISLYMFLICI